MGQNSSKPSSSQSEDSFIESPYLGPSGLHLGLGNSSVSVSQGLSQLQGI